MFCAILYRLCSLPIYPASAEAMTTIAGDGPLKCTVNQRLRAFLKFIRDAFELRSRATLHLAHEIFIESNVRVFTV